MQWAQKKLDSFLMVKRLFSLDQIQYVGMRMALAANEQRAIVDFGASLQLGPRPAAALRVAAAGIRSMAVSDALGHQTAVPNPGEPTSLPIHT